MPFLREEIPLMYEEEEEGDDVGESDLHVNIDEILHVCIRSHMEKRSELRVFSNMNVYYLPGPPHVVSRQPPNFSADTVVVAPSRPMEENPSSYTIDTDGPVPLLVAEILSPSTARTNDLGRKLIIYARLGIPEYILVDGTGRFLPARLQIRRLQPDRTWLEEQDADGGITSHLGYGLIWDTDGKLRVLNAITGHRYARPHEAEQEAEGRRRAEASLQIEMEARRLAEEHSTAAAEARRQAEERAAAAAEARRLAEERIQALEAELARLRTKEQGPTP